MKYSKKLILIGFALFSLVCYAQEKQQVASFFKLYVSNENDEILLVNWKGAWEIPGTSYNEPLTISEFLDSIAIQNGITIKNKKLAGQFTFHLPGRPYPTMMFYYSAKYDGGKIKTPTGCSDIKWFSYKNSMDSIPHPEMKLIIQKMNLDSNSVWGGAIKKVYNAESKSIETEYPEEFYKLN